MLHSDRSDAHSVQGQQTPQGLTPLFTPQPDNNQLTPSITTVWGMENAVIIKLTSEKHLSPTNWIVWCEQMIIMLELCKVYKYTQESGVG